MSGHVVIVEPSGRGGVGHYTCQLADALSVAGADVHLHTTANWNLLPNPGYRICRIYRRWGANPFKLASSVLRERARAPAVIHWQSATHPRRLRMVQYLWYPKGSTRWVHTVHNVLPHDTGLTEHQPFRLLYGAADGLIVHAEASRARFVEIFPDLADRPHTIIPVGHFGFLAPWSERLSPLDRREPVVLFFGTIRPYKGLHDLLEAMALLRKEMPRARLVIAGRPHESWEPYAEAIRRLGLDDAVSARLGYIPEAEVPTVLAQARVVCLPYRDIDQSGVLHLAMAAGIPVVTTRVGGLSEVVVDGETGFLVEPQAPPELASALGKLLSDDERLVAMGRRAREAAERDYAWDRIAHKTLDFYARLGANIGRQ